MQRKDNLLVRKPAAKTAVHGLWRQCDDSSSSRRHQSTEWLVIQVRNWTVPVGVLAEALALRQRTVRLLPGSTPSDLRHAEPRSQTPLAPNECLIDSPSHVRRGHHR